MRAYINGRIFTGYELITDKALLTDEGVVTGFCDADEVSCDRVDLAGRILAPGFTDLQVNGGGGVLFNSSHDTQSLDMIYSSHRARGTASICPTYITGDIEGLRDAAATVARYDRRHVPALHIEGFFISPKKRGIHDERYIQEPTPANLRKIRDCGSCDKIITLAPEVWGDNIDDAMAQLQSCTVFAGHTDCTDAEMKRFFRAGGAGVTHLYNAMSGLSGRNPGAVGAVFDSSAYAGIIADGHHVSYTSVRVAKRIMGERLYLVTDAMPPACSGITEYELYGERVYVKGGVCVSEEGVTAGSAICLADAVRNCVKYCNVDIWEAVRMATLYPANAINRLDSGRIEKGNAALFTAFDDELSDFTVYEN